MPWFKSEKGEDAPISEKPKRSEQEIHRESRRIIGDGSRRGRNYSEPGLNKTPEEILEDIRRQDEGMDDQEINDLTNSQL